MNTTPELLTRENSIQATIRLLLEHMNSKYGDSFTFVELANAGISMQMLNIWVESDRFPGEKVLVSGRKLSLNGVPEEIRDNYTAFLFREETRAYLTELASQVYGECSVIYNVFACALPADVEPSLPFSSYIVKPNIGLIFSIITVTDSNHDELAKKLDSLYKLLQTKHIRASATVFHTQHASLISKISISNCGDYFRRRDWYDSAVGFVMDEELNMINVEWRGR